MLDNYIITSYTELGEANNRIAELNMEIARKEREIAELRDQIAIQTARISAITVSIGNHISKNEIMASRNGKPVPVGVNQPVNQPTHPVVPTQTMRPAVNTAPTYNPTPSTPTGISNYNGYNAMSQTQTANNGYVAPVVTATPAPINANPSDVLGQIKALMGTLIQSDHTVEVQNIFSHFGINSINDINADMAYDFLNALKDIKR